jgi:COMPASS component SPP1
MIFRYIATGKQTSWKVKCANPACVKPARTAKSKHRGNKEVESRYCSDDCGLLLARARIANCDKKRRAALEDAGAQKTQIIKVRSAADMDDRKLLVTLREEQNKLEEAIAQADQRSRFLKLVIRRQQEHKSDDPGVEEVKSLGMKMKRADEGGICGFDSRLLWDNEEPWSKCLQEEDDDDVAIKLIDNGDYRVCLNNRKCQRHAQWQKLKTAEIDLERSEDIQALKKLKKQRHQAKVRMKNRRENVTEIVNNGVIDHRISSVVA